MIGHKSGWAREKQYNLSTVDKYSYLSVKQGVSIGYCYPDMFHNCWLETNKKASKEEWAEAFNEGLSIRQPSKL
jgi:hypothetical protein